MIHSVSKRITDFFLYKNIIVAEKYELYIYGAELLLSSFFSILSLVLVSVVLGTFREAVVFFLSFVSLRKYTGGYHCETYFKCNCTFILAYLICSNVSSKTLYYEKYKIIVFCCFFISGIIIFLFSPIENINKKIPNNKILYIKIVSIAILVIHLIIYIIINKIFNTYLIIIPITDLMVAISMLLSLSTTKKDLEVK